MKSTTLGIAVPTGTRMSTCMGGPRSVAAAGAPRSDAQRGGQPRGALLPPGARAGEVVAVVEEFLHVESVELPGLVLVYEVGPDVRQVEVEPIALGREVDPIEIAEALGVDEERP